MKHIKNSKWTKIYDEIEMNTSQENIPNKNKNSVAITVYPDEYTSLETPAIKKNNSNK